MKNHKKLILIGSSGSVHLKNYYDLIKDFFDDILIVTNSEIDFCNFKVIDFGLAASVYEENAKLPKNIKGFGDDEKDLRAILDTSKRNIQDI